MSSDSRIVLLAGWKIGLRKVSLVRLISGQTSLRLREAKDAVDSLLEGKTVEISFDSRDAAERFLGRAVELGAIARFKT